MEDIAVTGAGLLLGGLRTSHVRAHIAANQEKTEKSAISEEFLHSYQKEVARKIAREDRSILTNAAAQCLITAMDAFDMAEAATSIAPDVREAFGVFTSAERDREFPVDLWRLVHHQEWDEPPTVETVIARYGELRERIHPLGLFKKLPTNPLYHLSKYFQCRGGGYPVQRMSLGGLCILEEASAKIGNRSMAGAILSAYGNMASLDNILAFEKMGLIRNKGSQDGIVPAAGSASVVLEPVDQIEARGGTCLAKIQRVRTSYNGLMHAGEREWLRFYDSHFSDVAGTEPVVILYDNGNLAAGEQERSAIERFFGRTTQVSYKKLTGYTGQANNLIDLVFALADPAVPAGRPILLNGIGSSAGMGAMMFEKCISSLPVPSTGEAEE